MYEYIKDTYGNKYSIYSNKGKRLINNYIGGKHNNDHINISKAPKSSQKKGRFTVAQYPPEDAPQNIPVVEPKSSQKKGRFTVSPSPPEDAPQNIPVVGPKSSQKKGRFTVSPSPPEDAPQNIQVATPNDSQKIGRFTKTPVPIIIPDTSTPKGSRKTGRFTQTPISANEEVSVAVTKEFSEIISEKIILEENINIKTGNYTFKLIENIGEGGQGVVWVCKLLNEEENPHIIENNNNSPFFSVKFMKPPKGNTWQNSALKKEIKNIKKINNKCKFVVKTYDILNVDTHIVIIMEYINNISLSKFILTMRLKFRLDKQNITNVSIKIIEQMIKGLKYLHDNNIVHRDIKPDNILLDLNEVYYENDTITVPHIKYIDFGMSCGKYETNECVNYNDKTLAVPGTIIYMAPELLRHSPYKKIFTDDELEDLTFSQKTDIFSLGITIYEMFHGFTPYQDPDLWEHYNKYLPLKFIEERLKFLPIKSKLCKLINNKEFSFFDFIINIMIVDDPEMRVDINLLNSIFDGTYEFINDIPNVDVLNKINRLNLNLNTNKISCSARCPTKSSYLSNKLTEPICQKMTIFNYLPLSCHKICSESHSWKMAKCSEYIPSIDHLVKNNKTKTNEQLVIWVQREYTQHIETTKIVDTSKYNRYITF